MRVQTGCKECQRCNNSHMSEFGRRQGKFWLNCFLFGMPLAVQSFTANCRACGHKSSLHTTAAPIPVTVVSVDGQMAPPQR